MRSKKRVRQKLIMARKSIEYPTEGGVCSKSMIVEVEDNIIKNQMSKALSLLRNRK